MCKVMQFVGWPRARPNSPWARLKPCPARLLVSVGPPSHSQGFGCEGAISQGKKRGCHSPCFRSSSFCVLDPTYAVRSRSLVRYLLARWLERKRCLSSVAPPIASLRTVAPEMEPLFYCSWRAISELSVASAEDLGFRPQRRCGQSREQRPFVSSRSATEFRLYLSSGQRPARNAHADLNWSRSFRR
jgi:hypothetical protein